MSAVKSVRIVDPLALRVMQNASASDPRSQQQVSYSSAQLSKICGASLRQLQLLDEGGVLVPAKSGGKSLRRYTQEQVTKACRLMKVRQVTTFHYFNSTLAHKIMNHDGPIEIIDKPKVIGETLCIPG